MVMERAQHQLFSAFFALCWCLKNDYLGSADFLLHAIQTWFEERIISSLVEFSVNVELVAYKHFTYINWFNFIAV